MNELWKEIQPDVIVILKILVGMLTTIVLTMLAMLQTKIKVWLASKTSANNMEIIHKVAAEAFALAEKSFKTPNGQAKYNYALSYTSERLAKAGIKVTADEIKAAIEKAVLDYNAKTKTP